MQQIDLTGMRFGKLTVVSGPNAKHRWHCRCECGNETDVLGSSLRSNNTQSCGCLRRGPKAKYRISRRPYYTIEAKPFIAELQDEFGRILAVMEQCGVHFHPDDNSYTVRGVTYGPFRRMTEAFGHAMIFAVGSKADIERATGKRPLRGQKRIDPTIAEYDRKLRAAMANLPVSK